MYEKLIEDLDVIMDGSLDESMMPRDERNKRLRAIKTESIKVHNYMVDAMAKKGHKANDSNGASIKSWHRKVFYDGGGDKLIKDAREVLSLTANKFDMSKFGAVYASFSDNGGIKISMISSGKSGVYLSTNFVPLYSPSEIRAANDKFRSIKGPLKEMKTAATSIEKALKSMDLPEGEILGVEADKKIRMIMLKLHENAVMTGHEMYRYAKSLESAIQDQYRIKEDFVKKMKNRYE